ncbi:unnamed protein product [Linum tenue]|uniref:Pectinesterase inhibitor domain-containing protein n=2 Tax=Linum tenue TaxID=586396 RepID=A0AAV0L141_9ROSI|nr:unnamed protein product [Linum tenue]
MASPRTSLVIAAIFFTLIFHFLPQTTAARVSTPSSPPSKLIEEVCKKSNDSNLCAQVLQSYPEASSATDIKSLAMAVLEIAKKQSKIVGNLFTELKNNGATDPSIKPSLDLCASQYNDAAIFFSPVGLGNVAKSLEVHSALDDSEGCQTELATKDVHVEFAPEIQKWKELYEVSSSVILYAEDVFGGKAADPEEEF